MPMRPERHAASAGAARCGELMRAFGYRDAPHEASFSNDVACNDDSLVEFPRPVLLTPDGTSTSTRGELVPLGDGMWINGDASTTRAGGDPSGRI